MRRISADRLIEITNLNLDFAAGASDRAKIAHVAIATNPNLRALGKRADFHSVEPLVIANRIAPHVSARLSGHLALANFSRRDGRPSGRATLCLFFTMVFCLGYRSCRRLERPGGQPWDLLVASNDA
jgi:hypothetical protein